MFNNMNTVVAKDNKTILGVADSLLVFVLN